MVDKKHVFEYQGQPLIEKIIIEPPFKYKTVFSNEGCFLYIKSGSFQLFSSENNLTVKEREAVLLECGVYFASLLQKTNEPIEVIAIHLFPDLLKQLYKNELPKIIKQRSSGAQIKTIVPDNAIAQFIESLEFYFQNPSFVNEDLLELKIKELILLLIQTQNSASVLELIEGLHSPRVANLKKVIELHKYENLTTEELANLCGMSLSSFKREFNSIYSDSPKNYLNTQKIQKAKELLEISDLPIGEIAYEVGFNDPYYFTRLFKKKEESSPTDYRKQQRG